MPDRFINGQALGMVSRLRYGLFPMSYNGCEIIAVYNYMRLHGVKTNMADLALEIYPKGSVLMGLFGSNPYMLRHYFQKRGMSEHGITDYERFKREFPKAGSAICSGCRSGNGKDASSTTSRHPFSAFIRRSRRSKKNSIGPGLFMLPCPVRDLPSTEFSKSGRRICRHSKECLYIRKI